MYLLVIFEGFPGRTKGSMYLFLRQLLFVKSFTTPENLDHVAQYIYVIFTPDGFPGMALILKLPLLVIFTVF